jgi:hypothetical protein
VHGTSFGSAIAVCTVVVRWLSSHAVIMPAYAAAREWLLGLHVSVASVSEKQQWGRLTAVDSHWHTLHSARHSSHKHSGMGLPVLATRAQGVHGHAAGAEAHGQQKGRAGRCAPAAGMARAPCRVVQGWGCRHGGQARGGRTLTRLFAGWFKQSTHNKTGPGVMSGEGLCPPAVSLASSQKQVSSHSAMPGLAVPMSQTLLRRGATGKAGTQCCCAPGVWGRGGGEGASGQGGRGAQRGRAAARQLLSGCPWRPALPCG